MIDAHRPLAAVAVLMITTAGCDRGGAPEAVIDPGDGGDYRVEIDPADFGPIVDHPFLPLLAGAVWRYEAMTEDGSTELITVEVLEERRTVMGVEATVVHDVVETADGELVEDTYDWYARDDTGNVWYFGEATTSYDDGVASEEGSWEAGVDGALPGIVMPADPSVTGCGYRQEHLPGEAEDLGQVIAVDDDRVRTRDWTPLEPDVVEEKTYERGVGFVHEVKTAGDGSGGEVTLIEFRPAS